MPDASPAKWHLAHTTWFFETFVLSDPALGRQKPFHPDFNFLFNSYYEGVGPRHPRPQRGLLTRPKVQEVFAYRAHVDQAMSRLLPQVGEADRDRLYRLVELGINHEQQHLELLLTDVKHLFVQNPLRPVYRDLPSLASANAPPLEWLEFDAGIRLVGHDDAGFAFDNEGPVHRVFLEPFALGSRLVTCGEYRQFIEEGGYDRPELWLADGAHARQRHAWEAPLYWERHDDCWKVFTLGGLRQLNDSEPVCHVSFYEADAYARWCGCRLPTETEWEIACADAPIAGNLFESGRFHPVPLTARCQELDQAFGDVWEWTQSPYTPYPGYRPQAGVLGEYNGKFMCNQMVLRGGSCVTPGSHIRSTYRNFFSPEARWQFSGFRLARDPGKAA